MQCPRFINEMCRNRHETPFLVTRSPHVRCNSNSTIIVLDQLHDFIHPFPVNVQDMLLHSITTRTLEKRLNGSCEISKSSMLHH